MPEYLNDATHEVTYKLRFDHWQSKRCPIDHKPKLLENVQVPGEFRPRNEQVERCERRLAGVIGKFHRNGFRARDNRRWLKLQGRVDMWGGK